MLEYRGVDLARQHRLARQLSQSQQAEKYYFIDVAGSCNLRCPSCAVGNMPAQFAKGLMAPDRLEAILDKIARDHRDAGKVFIDLYNWGEPLLHPDIGRIVAAVKSRGFGCGISSNLVIGKHLRDAVRAKPDYIRISLSGYHNATYGETHAGGDINAVKGNMYLLRHYLDASRNVDTVVQVGFHVYRTNFPDDFHRMFALADELGFLFSPTIATIMPVEKTVAVLENGEVDEQDLGLLDKLVISPAKWRDINLNSEIDLTDCQFRSHRSTINYDGSVSLCCATYERDKIIADDFMATDEAALSEKRHSHSYCSTCMGQRIHYVYTGVRPPALEEEAVRVLGPEYAAYLEATRSVGRIDVVAFDGAFRSIQEVYDTGIAGLSSNEPDVLARSEACFDPLVAEAPQFGEGLFQAASLKGRLGQEEEARRLAARALELSPDNPAYRSLAESCGVVPTS